MSLITFYDELKIRWASDSPKFFVTLRKFWLWIVGISGSVIPLAQLDVFQKAFGEHAMNQVSIYGGVIVAFAAALAAQTRLAVQTPTSTDIHEAAKTPTKQDDELVNPKQ
jgi:deoxyxylulose-5-phosphate synthase